MAAELLMDHPEVEVLVGLCLGVEEADRLVAAVPSPLAGAVIL